MQGQRPCLPSHTGISEHGKHSKRSLNAAGVFSLDTRYPKTTPTLPPHSDSPTSVSIDEPIRRTRGILRPGKKMRRGRPPTKAPRYAWSPAFTSRVSSVVSAGFCSAKGEVACYDHSGSIVTCLAAQRRPSRRHHQPSIIPPALPSPRHHPDVNQNVCRDRGAQVLALTRV